MKADQQYEEGFRKIKTAYSSIFDKSVLGKDATKRQNDYKKEALTQMKAIAATDLSDPKNVQIAEDIMAPFYEDKSLLYNIAGTSIYNNNVNKIKSGMFSKDEDERTLYDPIQLQDQEGYRRDLEEAGLDPEKQKLIEKREIAPFHDIRKELESAAGKNGWKIDWDSFSPDGQYIITTTNGERAIGSFNTLAKTVLSDPKFKGQFDTVGRVARDNAKIHVKRDNPNIPENELNTYIGNYVISEMDKNYQSNLSEYTTESQKLKKQLDDIKLNATVLNKDGKPAPTDAMYSQYQNIYKYKQMIDSTLSGLNDEYSQFKITSTSKKQAIIDNPVSYFGKMERDNVANNFAKEKAAQQGQSIKINEAYQNAIENAQWAEEQKWERNKWQEEHKYDDRDQLLEEKKEGLVWNAEKQDFDVIPGYAGKGKDGKAVYVDVTKGDVTVDNTSFLNIKDPYLDLTQSINRSLVESEDIYWNPNTGLAAAIVGTPIVVDNKSSELTIGDIDLVKDAMIQKRLDPKYKFTPKEKSALINVAAATGCKDYTDPVQMLSALSSKIDFNSKNSDSTPTESSQILANKKTQADNLLETALAKRRQLEGLVNNEVLSNPESHPELVISEDPVTGKKINSKMVDKGDFENIIKSTIGDIILQDGSKITPKQLADAYYTGNFDYSKNMTRYLGILTGGDIMRTTHLKNIQINGKTINIDDIKGFSGSIDRPVNKKGITSDNWPSHQFFLNPTGFVLHRPDEIMYQLKELLENRFDESKKFASKRRAVENRIVSQISDYKDASGERGVKIGYNSDLDPSVLGTKNYLANAMANPANRNMDNIFDGAGVQITDPAKLQAISDILKTGDDAVLSAEFITFDTKSGKPVIDITFRPDLKVGDKRVADGQAMVDLIGTGHVIMEINQDTKDEKLKQLLQTAELGMYADMRNESNKGQSKYGSNSLQKSHGFDAKITGTDYVNGKATKFTITGTARVIDPETGKLVPIPITKYSPNGGRANENYSGQFSKVTPYQVMTLLNNTYNSFYTQNINNYRKYKSKNSSAPSFEEIEKGLNNQ